jgi:hypothetical protein
MGLLNLALACTQVFAVKHYQPHLYEYPKFDGAFRRLLADAEAAAEASRRPTAQPKTVPATTNGQRVRFLTCDGAWNTVIR